MILVYFGRKQEALLIIIRKKQDIIEIMTSSNFQDVMVSQCHSLSRKSLNSRVKKTVWRRLPHFRSLCIWYRWKGNDFFFTWLAQDYLWRHPADDIIGLWHQQARESVKWREGDIGVLLLPYLRASFNPGSGSGGWRLSRLRHCSVKKQYGVFHEKNHRKIWKI